MRNPLRSPLGQTIALQYLTLGLGIGWGTAACRVSRGRHLDLLGLAALNCEDVLTWWIGPAALAVAGLIVSAYRLRTQVPADTRTFGMVLGLVVYAGGLIAIEPLRCVAGGVPENALVAVAIVLPPFLCFRRLVERRTWLAAAALALFLAPCIALMFYNAPLYWGGGIGLRPGPRECR